MRSDRFKIVDNIIYTPEADGTPDPKGVGHFYYNQMIKNSDKVAQIDGYTREEDTFGSLLQRSVRTALTIIDKGLKPGDFISICSYNHLNTCVPHVASFFTGTILAAIDPAMCVAEAVYLLQQILPKIIFVTPTEIPLVEKIVKRLGTNTEIVVFGETIQYTPFEEFLVPHKNEHLFKPREVQNLNEIATVLFTSGTTGMPKPVCLSHFNLLCFSKPCASSNFTIVLCTFANPYWNVFLGNFHSTIQHGFTRVVYPRLDLNEPWALFYQHVDMGFLNPLQALHMIKSKKPEKADLTNVKMLRIGGNPVTPKQFEEITRALPYTLVKQVYGQTEALQCLLGFESDSSEALMKNNVDSVGTVIPGTSYKIVDVETEKALGPNRIGELRIKTPAQTIGYLNQDTSEGFDSDGWLKTGDLFCYNEDACFYFVDRIKDTFKFYNYHISPLEIETVILNLEQVEIAVVIGLPHETEDCHPMAIVKLKRDAENICVEDIINCVESRLDDKKRLRGGVKFIDNFPMTTTGKINRYKLKQMVLNKEI